MPRNGGVDYSSADPDVVDGTVGIGAAALFIGKKEDMSLLAVGIVTHVDGSPGATINENSRTVTFTVKSLEAGVHVPSLANINATVDFTEDGKVLASFPAYSGLVSVNNPTAILTNYEISLYNTTAPDNRFAAIRSVNANPKILSRNPSFRATSAGKTGSNIKAGDPVTVSATAYLRNAMQTIESHVVVLTGGQIINDDGEMALNLVSCDALVASDTTTPRITSLGFSIPVYAVTDDAGSGSAAKQWILSSGSAIFNIDAGSFTSTGGCILVWLGSSATTIQFPITESDIGDGIYVYAGY